MSDNLAYIYITITSFIQSQDRFSDILDIYLTSIFLGTIYEALDLHQNNKKVAIKVEKEDKSKKVLQFEYSVLINIQGKKMS